MKASLAFLCFLTIVSAQSLPPQLSKYEVNCASLFSAGCSSYNEMVQKKDKQLLHDFDTYDHAFACFRTAEDVFMLLYYSDPVPDAYSKSPLTNPFVQQEDFVSYARYKHGLLDDYQATQGLWRKRAHATDNNATFVSSPSSDPSARIDDSEISFFYTFQNIYDAKTSYSLRVRKSTLRFSEVFEWQGQKNAKKDQDNAGMTDNTGQCAEVK